MPEVLTEAAAAIPPTRDYITVETNVIVRCLDCGQTDCATATAAATRIEKEISERSRLEREVIEAAKAERVATKTYNENLVSQNWYRSVETRIAREQAVDALIEFESSQQQIKK